MMEVGILKSLTFYLSWSVGVLVDWGVILSAPGLLVEITYDAGAPKLGRMDMGMLQGITETWDRLEERLQLAK